jgi:hypothetical protein
MKSDGCCSTGSVDPRVSSPQVTLTGIILPRIECILYTGLEQTYTRGIAQVRHCLGRGGPVKVCERRELSKPLAFVVPEGARWGLHYAIAAAALLSLLSDMAK